jgi:hypothetical protein
VWHVAKFMEQWQFIMAITAWTGGRFSNAQYNSTKGKRDCWWGASTLTFVAVKGQLDKSTRKSWIIALMKFQSKMIISHEKGIWNGYRRNDKNIILRDSGTYGLIDWLGCDAQLSRRKIWNTQEMSNQFVGVWIKRCFKFVSIIMGSLNSDLYFN